MEHVNGERVESRDVDAPQEGPHDAVGTLPLVLVRKDTKRGRFFQSLTGSSSSTSSSARCCMSSTGLRAAHLFIELDLVFQDDPIRSVRLLPCQRQAVPGDVSHLDG